MSSLAVFRDAQSATRTTSPVTSIRAQQCETERALEREDVWSFALDRESACWKKLLDSIWEERGRQMIYNRKCLRRSRSLAKTDVRFTQSSASSAGGQSMVGDVMLDLPDAHTTFVLARHRVTQERPKLAMRPWPPRRDSRSDTSHACCCSSTWTS